jgi:hypothetical protein
LQKKSKHADSDDDDDEQAAFDLNLGEVSWHDSPLLMYILFVMGDDDKLLDQSLEIYSMIYSINQFSLCLTPYFCEKHCLLFLATK